MNDKDFPQTELQRKIYNFWAIRGWSDARAVLGNLNVSLRKDNPRYDDNGISYQYLEQFYNEAYNDGAKESQKKIKELEMRLTLTDEEWETYFKKQLEAKNYLDQLFRNKRIKQIQKQNETRLDDEQELISETYNKQRDKKT